MAEETGRVEALIPRQLVEDAQGLIEFLKEYYKFLNREDGPSNVIQTLMDNRNLDRVVDSFIDLIHKELGAGFVTKLSADKINLYKHIGEFYRAKGSIASFKTLFRALFDTEVEITLPKEQILVASDGRWVQQNSIFIEVTSGDPFDLFANIIEIKNELRNVKVEVERIRRIDQSDFYEIFITKSINTSRILENSTIDELGVQATLVKSLSSYEIVYPGSNFEVPQFVNIVNSASGTNIKIRQLNSSGGIADIKYISFGIGYPDEFYARIIPTSEIVGGIDLVITTDPEADQLAYPTHAILKFSNQIVSQYSGEYVSNNGFLSDDIYLQDNYYYQQYSYLIRSGIQFESYKNIVKKTVHPSGMIMFGAFEINNDFDVSRNLDSLLRYYVERFEDAVDTTDNDYWNLTKPRADEVFTSQTWDFHLTKRLYEIVESEETLYKQISKSIPSDTVNAIDNFTYLRYVNRFVDDILYHSDTLVISIEKPLNDDINNIDSGVIEMLNDIYAEDYFSEDYSEGLTSFT